MEVSTEVWQERARVLLERSEVMGHFVIESSGVWNASERGTDFDDFPVDCEIERSDAAWTFAPGEWKPALAIPELADKDVPSLPFPFTAPELAAFMLGGMGAMVADFFGDWTDGPSTQSLNKLPAGQSELRALVKGAYSAYRMAQERVGKLDEAALARRDAANKAYRGSSNDKALLKAFEDAQAEWDAAHKNWLTAMVVCLLEPELPATTEATEPEWHLMATADELCAAFGTFTGMRKDWFANLNDKPALKAARFQPGQGGRNKVEPLFYVYAVLLWLLDKRRKTGKPMQEATGWRMLKQHFPRVYDAHELSAPDPD